ncbi:MAG: glycosyltransferase WbuB [Planctomycetota bacterium]|nr:MAG: glycosyltransferase WbuB [Planctomycetota bacterium]
MRIVYIHQYFRTRQMSGGTRSLEMARRLVAMGHEVDLVTSDNEPAPGTPRGWRVTNEEGIRVHWYPLPYSNKMSYADRLKSFFAFAWKSSRRAAGIPCDVVFATSTPLTVAIPGTYAAWRRRVPMVFEVRDLWPDMPIAIGALKNPVAIAAARMLERYAYRHSTRIVALSPEMKAGVIRTGFPETHVAMIPNACDLDLFPGSADDGRRFRASLPWLGDRPLVIYAGAIAILNGCTYLVDLAKATKDLNPEVRFLLIGEGNDLERVRTAAAERGVLDKNLFFLPRIAKQEVPAALAAATLATSMFVDVPGTSANSPNKFFDAIAAGRPVAVNHRGWIADIVRDRDCGLALPPGDAAAGAKPLVEAIADPVWLARAGANARRTAEELFDRDKLAVQLEGVLREAVAAAGRPTTQPVTDSSP